MSFIILIGIKEKNYMIIIIVFKVFEKINIYDKYLSKEGVKVIFLNLILGL